MYNIKKRGAILNIENILRQKNLRITKQRKLILETLLGCNNPISADEIYELIKEDIRVDLSTIYRNLNTLEENEILLKNTNIDGISYYQLNNEKHKHFITCTSCHKKFTIENCPVHSLEEKIEDETGFILTGHNFEFTGICPDCQRKEKEKGK